MFFRYSGKSAPRVFCAFDEKVLEFVCTENEKDRSHTVRR